MTVTERRYSQKIGKLYWSKQRNSLVLVMGMHKPQYSNKWKYNVTYTDKAVVPNDRAIFCTRVEQLIKAGNWIPADQYITSQPPESSTKN